MPRYYYYIALGLIFVLALSLRLYKIEQKNMWFDEVYSWNLSLDTPKDIIATASGDIHPPLFYITLKGWTNIFSDSVFSMRMLSTLLSMLSMFFLFKICKEIKITEKRILLILILYAVSPLNIYYSQEVRMQSLNLFLTISSTFFFIRFLNSRKNVYGFFWSICAALSLYTHYFALLILFSQFVILVIKYLQKEIDLKFSGVAFLFGFIPLTLFSPWVPTFLKQSTQGQPWRVGQSLMQVLENYVIFFKEIFFSNYWNYENSGVIIGATVVSIILILFILISSVIYFKKSDKKKLPIILLFFIPSIIAIFVSFRQSIIFSRYLSIILPYLLILCVFFIFRIHKKYISYPLIIILIGISAYGLTINYSNDYKNNDYRKIESYIEKNLKTDDKIIVDPHYLGWVIRYDNTHQKTSLPVPHVLGWSLQMQIDSIAKRTDFNNVWLVLDYASMEKNDYDSLNTKMNLKGFKADTTKEKTFYIYPNKVKTSYFYK
ncbi:MAG: glycosyltransferase family 39 protein [Bacteroidetes bacterium]|nr:glycosyltransferase family 39 protein [Bacteroidota bacterium]